MEVYLNVIEFGNGIYGIQAASQYYFNTSASKLTSYQSAFLCALLPNPRYFQKHLNGSRFIGREDIISSNVWKIKSSTTNRNFVRSLKD